MGDYERRAEAEAKHRHENPTDDDRRAMAAEIKSLVTKLNDAVNDAVIRGGLRVDIEVADFQRLAVRSGELTGVRRASVTATVSLPLAEVV
jgi:hypothetical protein